MRVVSSMLIISPLLVLQADSAGAQQWETIAGESLSTRPAFDGACTELPRESPRRLGISGREQTPGSIATLGRASGVISGTVFDDVDHDGRRDEGEPGIDDWRIVLSGTVSQEIRTDVDGRYVFAGLDSGNYVVTVFAPASWTVTYPVANFYVLSLAGGAAMNGMDFGWGFPWNSIAGIVFEDLNENGVFDSLTERALPDWPVTLSGYSTRQGATDERGKFYFDRLLPVCYRVTVGPLQPGWEPVPSGVDPVRDQWFAGFNEYVGDCNFALHRIPPRVKIALSVTDNLHIARRAVWFGVRPGASFGIWGVDTECRSQDYAEGEFEIPPILPGIFDIRLVDPARPSTGRFGLGSWSDMRPYTSEAQADTYRLQFQPGIVEGGDYPMTVTWSRTQVESSYTGPVILRDSYGRETDLKQEDSLVVNDSTVGWLLIIAKNPVIPAVVEHVPLQSEGSKSFRLAQNYPNPFNATTAVSFAVGRQSFISLKVYDGLGCEVAVLVDEVKHPGEYTVRWNAGGAASGVYYCRLQSDDVIDVKKLILMK